MAPELPSPFIDPNHREEIKSASYPRGFDPEAFLLAIQQGVEDLPAFLASPSAAFLEAIAEGT